MGIGFGRINGNRILESLDGLAILAALLVNQPELILCLAVVRIHGGRLQHAVEVLAAAQAAPKTAELTGKVVVRKKQEKRRGDPAQQEAQGPPNEKGCDERDPREADNRDSLPVLCAEDGAHGE